ncbi:unnamed protein product [Rhodiola kirilowii]
MGRPSSFLQLLALVMTILIALGIGASRADNELMTLSAFKRTVSDLSSWNSSTPLCTWSGITCKEVTNGTFNVIRINLSGRNLTGKVNGLIFSQLSHLESLDLSCNNLTGHIPADIFACASLNYLNMSNNNLSGSIPSLLSSSVYSSVLETLDLSNNALTGEIPESFGELFSNLKYIDIGGNLLVGDIPETLTSLTSLEILTLASNRLTGRVPRGWNKMKKLKFLYLGYNNLSGSIPYEIGHLSSLNHLNLVFNNLTGSIPSSLGNLSNLQYLFLYQNSISGSIPKSVFGLKKLVSLDLSDNFLTGEVAESLGDQQQELEIIQLFSNRLSGTIPRGVARLPRLRVLQLWENNFTGSIPGELGKHSNLTVLDLSTNFLTGRMPENLCHSSHLSKLILFSNSLHGKIPKGIAQCKTLSRIRLEDNRLSGEVPAEFWKLPLVSYLDIANNKLTGAINEVKWEMPNLMMVKMGMNKFYGMLPESFGSKALMNVDLSDNELSGNIPKSVGNVSKLVQLRLRGNKLSGTIPDELSFCKKLVYLDLSHNRFRGEIPTSISALSVLEELDLSENELYGEIPSSLGEMESLVKVNVSHNHLHGSLPKGGPFLVIESSAVLGNDDLCQYKSEANGLPQCENRKSFTQWWLLGLGVVMVLLVGMLAFLLIAFVRKRCNGLEPAARRVKSEDGLWEVQFFDSKSSKAITFDDIHCKENKLIARGTNWSSYKGKSKTSGKEFIVTHWNGLNSVSSILWTALTELGRNKNQKALKMIGICRSELDGCLILHESDKGKNLREVLPNLNWAARKHIARRLAKALQAVHSCTYVPIVDLSPEMITLEDDFEPNLHIVLPESTHEAVTLANQALNSPSTVAIPEGGEGMGEKEDILSFGVILIVLLSGKFPSDSKFGPKQKSMVEWAHQSFIDPYDNTWIDDRIGEREPGNDGLRDMMKLALRCTASEPAERPSATDACKFLDSLVIHYST